MVLGSEHLGKPNARTQSALGKITDLSRLEALIKRISTAESWHALLADTTADQS